MDNLLGHKAFFQKLDQCVSAFVLMHNTVSRLSKHCVLVFLLIFLDFLPRLVNS